MSDLNLDPSLSNDVNPLLDIEYVPLLQSILHQAVHDAIKLKLTNPHKLDATKWLCDEDDNMLQLCLTSVNMNYESMLKKVAKQGWNINL
jgi:hypothetical protein